MITKYKKIIIEVFPLFPELRIIQQFSKPASFPPFPQHQRSRLPEEHYPEEEIEEENHQREQEDPDDVHQGVSRQPHPPSASGTQTGINNRECGFA